MQIRLKTIAVSLSAIGIGLSLFCISSVYAAEHVKVGYLPVTGHAKFFIAKEQGFFAKEGLDAELVEFINSADGLASVRAGKVDVGADCLSIDDEASLRRAKEKVGGQVRPMGSAPPAAVMFMGSPAEVRKAVHACVAQAWDNPKGYIVASGCSLPTDTPFPNIDAMMDTVRETGFPVNASSLELT